MNATVSDEGRVPDVPQRNELGKPTPQKTKAPTKAGSATWLVAALLLLSAIPLAGGAEITPANAQFFAPLPTVLHIVGAAVYFILGAFQCAKGSGGTGPAGTRHRAARGAVRAAGWAVSDVKDVVLSLAG